MKRACTILLCLSGLLMPPRPAHTASLFFTPENIQHIEEQIKNNPPAAPAASKHLLHLESILYFTANHWVVWMQGEKWTPQTQRAGITLRDVTPDHVRLSLHLQGETAESDITLAPHQSLNLLTGKIVEGL